MVHSILYIYLFSDMTKFRNCSDIQVSMDDFFFLQKQLYSVNVQEYCSRDY